MVVVVSVPAGPVWPVIEEVTVVPLEIDRTVPPAVAEIYDTELMIIVALFGKV